MNWSPLKELYHKKADPMGWSYEDVAQRSTSKGARGVKKSRVGQLISQNPLRSISRDNIISLADGLGLSHERVALAAVQSMGFHFADEGATPAEAIARDPDLSDDTKEALLSILRAAEKRKGDGDGNAAPTSAPVNREDEVRQASTRARRPRR